MLDRLANEAERLKPEGFSKVGKWLEKLTGQLNEVVEAGIDPKSGEKLRARVRKTRQNIEKTLGK